MSDFLLYLLIAIVVSILTGRVLYRANNVLGFMGFITLFVGILVYAVFFSG
jgi:hypothetical protein